MKKIKSRLIFNFIILITSVCFLFSFKAFVKASTAKETMISSHQTKVNTANNPVVTRVNENKAASISSQSILYASINEKP